MSDVKVKLFAIAKDEAAYLPTWVFHHFYFGFEEIEVWLNNIKDNSLEICEIISKQFPNFKYKVVDDILHHCHVHNIPFQHVVYNKIFKEEAELKHFTHICYLDLDEFWVSRDFTTKVNEFVSKLPASNTISFAWYYDSANMGKLPFEKVFPREQLVYKNRHVKSMVSLDSDVHVNHAHNTLLNSGTSIFSDGSTLAIDESTQNGSLISIEKFTETHESLDEAFILYAMYKSQVEYISSLLKGNKQDNKQEYLKNNRYGYMNEGGSILFSIEQSLYDEYMNSYMSFLDKLSIFLQIHMGQTHILSRYEKVCQIFAES